MYTSPGIGVLCSEEPPVSIWATSTSFGRMSQESGLHVPTVDQRVVIPDAVSEFEKGSTVRFRHILQSRLDLFLGSPALPAMVTHKIQRNQPLESSPGTSKRRSVELDSGGEASRFWERIFRQLRSRWRDRPAIS